MYQSPIEILFGAMKIVEKQNNEIEEYVYEYMQEIGVNVDREELLKALRYDRDQYEKGFADGQKEKQSHWIDTDGMYTCAHCGSECGVMMTYCGECGCRMGGDLP